jgi:hypothetical protein
MPLLFMDSSRGLSGEEKGMKRKMQALSDFLVMKILPQVRWG